MKLTRHDITHLVWSLLAEFQVDLKMSYLHRKYPDTNHTTKVSRRHPDVSLNRIGELLRKKLLAVGWKADTGGNMYLMGTHNRTVRCCVLLMTLVEVELLVTPFFYYGKSEEEIHKKLRGY